MNRLYCGDNLRVLKEEIPSESVDLVYLDPPFNSKADYSVIYREADGRKAAAQVQVFEDTWHWNEMSSLAFYQTVTAGGRVADALKAFQQLLGEGDMLAYLSMMAARLVELHRVLKRSGTLYLHCDPAASHYLKILLDAVFKPTNFRNEIVWQRTMAKSLMRRQLPRNHDSIFAFQKGVGATWNGKSIFRRYDLDNLDEKTRRKYRNRDADGRLYQLTSLINPNQDRPNLTYEFMGVTRVWRWKKSRMKAALDAGLVVQTRPGSVPRFKRYLDEQRGKPLGDVWTDIPPLNSRARERLGYPTQKPKALLERIIAASSNEGDVVLDPFCGCGTTIDAAQGLGRQWIGIDVTHLAIGVIRSRLSNEYPDQDLDIHMGWMPTTEDDARKLFTEDAFQFQCWVMGECGINPLYHKRGADRGVDGRLFFFEEGGSTTPAQIVFSVKGGKLSPAFVRELVGVVKRERAQIGVLVTMEKPTAAMVKEAASAPPLKGRDGNLYPGIQLLTVQQILDGYRVQHPPGRSLSFPDAKMAKAAAAAATIRQPALKFA